MHTSRRLFYSISFISFIGPFLSTGLTIALPQVAAGFGVPAEQVSWVVTAYLIGTASLLLPTYMAGAGSMRQRSWPLPFVRSLRPLPPA